MTNEDDKHKTEILIIRRSSGDEHGGHHGGAWKIAYADFVTAMMAFFLVMWLINSANEATRARVASYFNPIKMTDAAASGRSLKDLNSPKKAEGKAKPETNGASAAEAADSTNAAKAEPASTSVNKSIEDILGDPYKTIEKISSEGQAHPSGRTIDLVSAKAGDPFDPKAWEALREGKQYTDASALETVGAVTNGDLSKAETPSKQQLSGANPNVAKNVIGDGEQSAAAGPLPIATALREAVKFPENLQNGAVPATTQTSDPSTQGVIDQAVRQIKSAIAGAGAERDLSFSVKMTSEGLLIVLSDRSTQPMFGMGSARPTPALVEVVGAIGKVLASQQGKVVVRGHTDARQFKTLSFDNWQLSTARAHMASYILLHGGLEEQRILKIEGYGSSEPLNAANPNADENRRVEFLLRK